eukprot:COSAG01_NODE_1835_length_9084_cov_87.179481_8_plen_66_part_00
MIGRAEYSIGLQWLQTPRHGDPIANQKQTDKVARGDDCTARSDLARQHAALAIIGSHHRYRRRHT